MDISRYRFKDKSIFLVVDGAALKFLWIRKNLMKSMIVWKNYFDGTVCERSFDNKHYKEQEASVIDGRN